MAENKIRLDVALVERGLIESRSKAGALIMAGQVYVNDQKTIKAGTLVQPKDRIEIRGEKMPFVSRGGYKLDKAVKSFGFSLKDCVCMDIGASTGGFTDCMSAKRRKKGFRWWTSDTDSLPGNYERTSELSIWNARIFAI